MKQQPTTPQVLEHLLLVQHGTIGSHQHVIARVQPFKSSVVLLLQCAIENVRVDAQYLLCRHAISSRTPESNPLEPLWSNRISPSFKDRFTSCRNLFPMLILGSVRIRARTMCVVFSREFPPRTQGVCF